MSVPVVAYEAGRSGVRMTALHERMHCIAKTTEGVNEPQYCRMGYAGCICRGIFGGVGTLAYSFRLGTIKKYMPETEDSAEGLYVIVLFPGFRRPARCLAMCEPDAIVRKVCPKIKD